MADRAIDPTRPSPLMGPPTPLWDLSGPAAQGGSLVSADVLEVVVDAREVGSTGDRVMGLRAAVTMPGVGGLPALQDAVTLFSQRWIVALGEAGNNLTTIGRYGQDKAAALRAAGG